MQEPWYEERRHREMRSQQTVAWLHPHPLVTLGALELPRMPEPPQPLCPIQIQPPARPPSLPDSREGAAVGC